MRQIKHKIYSHKVIDILDKFINYTIYWFWWAIFVFNLINSFKSNLLTARTGPSSNIPPAPWRRRKNHLDRWRSCAASGGCWRTAGRSGTRRRRRCSIFRSRTNKFGAVETIPTISIGLSILLCVDVIYIFLLDNRY